MRIIHICIFLKNNHAIKICINNYRIMGYIIIIVCIRPHKNSYNVKK